MAVNQTIRLIVAVDRDSVLNRLVRVLNQLGRDNTNARGT